MVPAGPYHGSAWENQRRLERLQVQLIALVRAMRVDQADETATILIRPAFEQLPV